MVLFYIIAVLATVGVWLLFRFDSGWKNSWSKITKILSPLFAMVIGSLVAFLLCFFVSLFVMDTDYVNRELQTIQEYKLVSLESKSETGGSFFLGIGSIDQDEYYIYFIEHPDGAKEKKRLNYKDVKIYDNVEPDEARVEKFINANLKSKNLLPMFEGENSTTKWQYRFYVPNGSIKRIFKMN